MNLEIPDSVRPRRRHIARDRALATARRVGGVSDVHDLLQVAGAEGAR